MRIRLGTRRLMLVVAVAAALIWSAMMAVRRAEYLERATRHEEICRVLASEIRDLDTNGRAARQPGLDREIALREDALARQKLLLEKYRRAMRRPWMTVEPDPR